MIFHFSTGPKIWALILLSSLCVYVYVCAYVCVCISMTWPVFVLAAIQKRPSVQSDKVPISQSCDSDFLSVCPTAAEGLSIRAHARVPPISSNTNSCSQLKTVMSALLSLSTLHVRLKTLDYRGCNFINLMIHNCSVDAS